MSSIDRLIPGKESADLSVSESGRPLLSIIISNYNYEAYIANTISSALQQTYENTEVIVVDDGSTDDSWKRINEFSAPRLKCIRQENAGQAAAINRGFKESRGEIAIFLDGDDMLHPEAAESVVASWEPGISRIQYPLEVIDKSGNRLGLHPFGLEIEDGDVHWRLAVCGFSKFSPMSGNAFSRHALEAVLPVDEKSWRICADTYLVVTTPKCGPVKNLYVPLGNYRIHGQNSWYTTARSPDKAKAIWRNHVQSWIALAQHIEPEFPASTSAKKRKVRGAVELYILKRCLIAQSELPKFFSRGERRKTALLAMRSLFRGRLELRHFFLYLLFLLAILGGAWKSKTLKGWIIHRCARPAAVNALVSALKGPDYYAWMRMRDLPKRSAPLLISQRLRFGPGGTARAYQWYGWSRSGLSVDWCIGAEAALVMTAPDTTDTIVFEAQVLSFVGGPVDRQAVRIYANDEVIHTSTLPGGKSLLRALIPSRTWRNRSQLILRLVTPDCVAPRLVSEATEDYRPISLGFLWMRFAINGSEDRFQPTIAPYLRPDRWVSFKVADEAVGLLRDGWRKYSDGLHRMARRTAQMKFSLLQPKAGNYLLSLRFEPEIQSSAVAVQADSLPSATLNLAQQAVLDILLPHGTIGNDGVVTVRFGVTALRSASSRGLRPDGAAGPALVGLRLQCVDEIPKRPIFQPGQWLDFKKGGNGKPYLKWGWWPSAEDGSYSSDTAAGIEGLWFASEEDVFVTAQVMPAIDDLEHPQTVQIWGQGTLLASYELTGPSELTAIVPARLLNGDKLLKLELRSSTLSDDVRETARGIGKPAGLGLVSLCVS